MPQIPRLLAITDRHALDRWIETRGAGDNEVEALSSWARVLDAHGVDAIQLREKDLDDRRLFELATLLRRAMSHTRLVINGRADLAVACGSWAVHLPADGVPPSALRRRFGERLLIGCSTHHPDEVAWARSEGADYVTFGPIFHTPSKASYGPPPGPEALLEAAGKGLPVLALGGVGQAQMDEVARHGADGIAGIRIFQEPAHIPSVVATRDRIWPHPPTASTSRGNHGDPGYRA